MEQAALDGLDFRIAEFTMRRCFDLTAKLCGHRLHAVANPEHRYAEFEDDLRRARRVVEVDGLRASREDDAIGLEGANILL